MIQAKLISYLVIAVAVAALLGVGGAKCYRSGQAYVQAKFDTYKAEQTTKLLEIERRYREKEQQWVQTAADLSGELAEARRADQKALDDAIADISSERLRLRNKFRGCQRQLSEASTPRPGLNGADEGGLSSEDAGFLVRESKRANECVRRLTYHQKRVERLQ